ncbi:response regulator [Candidatus Symbiobacter mobilis]|uniref:Response regulator n=1 Tax=Candidatus Symbiobacter mobilis CR TaxID=946483 RepID=U5NC98_9BURK|nr:response regulator transcription factor [Candidatus Symbiobacter mobilis]AGX87828.1 response regulator [Candidatus Symbiobacter mobilis CR]
MSKMQTNNIRILIVDDHAIVRSGLKMIFEHVSDFQVAGEASNSRELLEQLSKNVYDILLLDMNMPGMSGAELISRIKACYPCLPILVLSMYDEPHIAMMAIKAGASGYITKDCDLDVLLPAIRAVSSHQTFITPGLAAKMVFTETPSATSALHSLLTNREMQVFKWLVAGLSINDIAATLGISNKTVSTHKAKMMEKLHVSSIVELTRYAIQHNIGA